MLASFGVPIFSGSSVRERWPTARLRLGGGMYSSPATGASHRHWKPSRWQLKHVDRGPFVLWHFTFRVLHV